MNEGECTVVCMNESNLVNINIVMSDVFVDTNLVRPCIIDGGT